MASKFDIPDTPTKHVDFLPDLGTIEATIAEGAVWLDRHAPVHAGPERTEFVGFLKGLMRYTTEMKDYFSKVKLSAASGSALNILDQMIESIEFCISCPDDCLGQIDDGSEWRVGCFRHFLQDAIETLKAETHIESQSTSPKETNMRQETDRTAEAVDTSAEIEQLVSNTPPFSRDNGKWIKNTLAAKLEGVEARTLASYRQNGIVTADKSLGRDADRRVWRRPGTPTSHPWYLRHTLKCAQLSSDQNRR